MTVVIERDALFGEVQVDVDRDDATVAVSGETIPTVVLRRLDGAKPDPNSPIGSRDAAGLELLVDGVSAVLRPGPGQLTRSSYRVDVVHAGKRYRLVADSYDRSVLRRDGKRLGQLMAVFDAGVSVEWTTGQDIDAVDAAIGYLLAAAFGTGGQHFLVTLVYGFFHSVP